ncbi:MAG: hypothetical protein GX267_18130 [Fibrobacter sp.]|jgi:uncharacterized membrane protein YdjX (TVP38/TMEM64 family)|nr:hypothetical protein [Fibrobacter sp.]
MIGKILFLPFWIISKIVCMLWGSIKLVIALFFGVFRLFFSHLFGAIIGAITGFLLGRKHIGIKIFNHHHHKKPHKKSNA